MTSHFRALLLTGLTLLMVSTPSTHACSCAEYLAEPAEQLEKSGLVFAGTVASLTVVSLPVLVYADENGDFIPSQHMERRAVVTLRVSREWKGNGSPTYTILAGAPPDPPLPPGYVLVDCEEHLEVGKEYLVFATEGYPEASSCAMTGLVAERSDAVKSLDEYVANRQKDAQ